MLTKTMPKKNPSEHYSENNFANWFYRHIIEVTEMTSSGLKEQIFSVVFNPIDLSSDALLKKWPNGCYLLWAT